MSTDDGLTFSKHLSASSEDLFDSSSCLTLSQRLLVVPKNEQSHGERAANVGFEVPIQKNDFRNLCILRQSSPEL